MRGREFAAAVHHLTVRYVEFVTDAPDPAPHLRLAVHLDGSPETAAFGMLRDDCARQGDGARSEGMA